MLFKDRLRELRILNGVTQNDIAVMLNVVPSTVSMWEQGKRSPDKETIVELSKYFNVSTDYLLSDIQEPDSAIIRKLQDNKVACSMESIIEVIDNMTISLGSSIKENITLDEIEFIIKYLSTLGLDIQKILEVRRAMNNEQ